MIINNFLFPHALLMLNFDYAIPTKIFFWKWKINVLSTEAKKLWKRTLLVYGQWSIKKNWIYDSVIAELTKGEIEIFELSWIQANPLIGTVKKGITIAKENNIDFVLAVGGGSVIDVAKAIAAWFFYEGDLRDMFLGKVPVGDALPIASILTLSATWSEMDAGSVITNPDTEEKLFISDSVLYPKFSILDPTYTYSVPKTQTAAWVADIMSHVFEQYFSNTPWTFLTDRMAEAILNTCRKYGETAISDPENYNARANIMRASSWALNGFLSCGRDTDRATHIIEHELSAIYDITHGVGLAILTPHRMEYVLDENNVDKFVDLAVNVRDITNDWNKMQIAKQAIEETRKFFDSLWLPSRLQEVWIDWARLEEMASKATASGEIWNFKRLDKDEVLAILKNSL